MEVNPPRSPELNGVAERLNRTLEEKATAMIAEKGIGKEFWGEAVVAAAYLKNRSPCSSLSRQITPEEAWTGRKPTVKFLKVWGSPTTVLIPKSSRSKFEGKGWRGIFVGYSSKGYRVWNPETRKLVTTRDVEIHENSVFDEIKKGSEVRGGTRLVEIDISGSAGAAGNPPQPGVPEGGNTVDEDTQETAVSEDIGESSRRGEGGGSRGSGEIKPTTEFPLRRS
jgi:hypothetical protein